MSDREARSVIGKETNINKRTDMYRGKKTEKRQCKIPIYPKRYQKRTRIENKLINNHIRLFELAIE